MNREIGPGFRARRFAAARGLDYIIAVAKKPTPAKPRAKPRAKSPSDYHHGDLRQALIAAALAEVDKDSAAAISLAGLARALGVSQAAPFRHFPDRDALLRAVAERGFTAFTETLIRAADAAPKRRVLHDMARAYVAFALARPGLYRLMFASNVLIKAPAGSALQRVAEGSFQLLVDAVGGRLPQALKVWSGLHGLVLLHHEGLLKDAPLDLLIGEIAR